MAFPFLLLAVVAFGFIGMILLMPKPKVENARPQNLSDLNFPTAAEGAPIPLLLGSIRHRGPNTLGYGGFKSVPIKKKQKTGLFSSKKVTVGYKYYISLDLGLGLGPGVLLKRIWFDKDEVWAGSVGPEPTALTINKPSLWGGEEKGGGFVGTLRFYGGQLTQAINARMATVVAPNDLPGYVGQSHIVLEDCYIGTQAQLRAMSFELARYTNGIGLDAGDNIIGEDLNPAEMLYQLATLDWGGLDVDPNDLELDSFRAAGVTLKAEGNGMSLLISSANSGKDAIDEVLRQIDGVMYQDPISGKIILELVRENYDVEDLIILDKSNVASVRSFSRTSWDDTVNQVRVTFTNRDNKFEKGTAIVQDLANINSQGRIRSTNMSFPGVTEGDLAARLAQREMAQVSVPMFRCTLEVNREAAGLRPGQAFIWSWDEYNIQQVVMRVQKFNLGELIDGRIVIDCVQDEFALDLTIFASPEPSLHQPQDRSALPITNRVVAEVPYWIMQQQDFAVVPPSAATRTFVMALARSPGEFQQGFTATIEQSGEAALAVDHETFTDTAILSTTFTRLAGFVTGVTSIMISGPSDNGGWLANAASLPAGDNMFMLGTEILAFETVTNNGNGTWTLNNVRRGLLDTRAVDHTAGEVLYRLTADYISEDEWLATTTMTGKFQSFTDKDETPYESAQATALLPKRRYELPLPPDWLTVGGSRAPTITTVGPHTIAWRPRTRLSTTVRLENDAADAEEAAVTYTMRVYLNDVLSPALTQTGLATPTANLTLPSGEDLDVRIEVSSVRAGLESYTAGFIEFFADVFTETPPGPPAAFEFGDDTYTASSSFPVGRAGLTAVTFPDGGTLQQVAFQVATASLNAKVMGLVYTDASGSAGSLVAQSLVKTGVTVGENVRDLTSPVTVPAGTTLWVGILVGTSAIDVRQRAGASRYWNEGDMVPPSPAPAQTAFGFAWALYGRGLEAGAVGPAEGAITAKQFRVRSVTNYGEAYWSLGDLAFLSGSLMPAGYTTFTTGSIAVGTEAQLFDGAAGRVAIATPATAGVKWATAQTIEVVRVRAPTSFAGQWPSEFVIEYRNEDADAWTVASTVKMNAPDNDQIDDFPISGWGNTPGFRFYKFEVVSNYGASGADTYFSEVMLKKDGVAIDYSRYIVPGDAIGAAITNEVLTHTGDGANKVPGPLPASRVIQLSKPHLVDQMAIYYRESPYQSQGPNRMRLLASRDGVSYMELLDTGTNGTAPTAQEIRTFTVPAAPEGFSRYRIGVTKNGLNSGPVSAARIQLRSSVGGTDLVLKAVATGTQSQQTNYGSFTSDPFAIAEEAQYGAMNTGGSAFWLRWSFTTAQDIRQFWMTSGLNENTRAPKDFSIQWSDDGTTWTTARSWTNETGWANPASTRHYAFPSAGSHLHWRINVTAENGGGYVRIGALRFAGADGVVLTSTTGRAGFASASSIFSGSYPAYNAFDAVDASLYISANTAPSVASPHYIEIDLVAPAKVREITWKAEADGTIGPQRAPKDFFLQGWNGLTWTTLESWTDQVFTGGQERAFVTDYFPADANLATRWRIRATDTPGNNDAFGVRELSWHETVGGPDVEVVGAGDTAIASVNNGGYPAFNAYDENTGTFWTSLGEAHDGSGHWIGIQFATARSIRSLTIRTRGQFNEDPTTYVVERSNDGLTWTSVKSGGAIPGDTPTVISW